MKTEHRPPYEPTAAPNSAGYGSPCGEPMHVQVGARPLARRRDWPSIWSAPDDGWRPASWRQVWSLGSRVPLWKVRFGRASGRSWHSANSRSAGTSNYVFSMHQPCEQQVLIFGMDSKKCRVVVTG